MLILASQVARELAHLPAPSGVASHVANEIRFEKVNRAYQRLAACGRAHGIERSWAGRCLVELVAIEDRVREERRAA